MNPKSRHSLILGCLLFFSLPGMPQAHLSLSDLPSVIIHLGEAKTALASCPFRNFEVIDQRADTARIGIHNYVPDIGNSRNRQLVFRQPAAREIAEWLNAHFTRPGAPFTGLIVLRNLWLSDANYLREDRIKNPDILYDRTHIRLKAEIYAVQDSAYIPIMRFDTLQTYRRNNQYNNINTYYYLWDRDLTDLLDNMIDSVSTVTPPRAETGRRIHLDDIHRFNHSRFDVPITQSATLNPGVYANFEEFRSNKPSNRNCEIRMEKKNRMLYIKDAGGASYYSHDAWGYCDGDNVYVMRDGILLPMWKEGGGYYFLGQAHKERSSPDNPEAPFHDLHLAERLNDSAREGNYPNASAPEPGLGHNLYSGNSRYAVQLQRIYTIDMDSGKIY
jgi:hypothetical protein